MAAWKILMCLVVVLMLTAIRAEDEDGDEGEETATTATAESGEAEEGAQTKVANVFTTTIFPGNSEKKFVAGKTSESLIGFENAANSTTRVEYIRAYLTSPNSPTQLQWNFSGSMYNTSVEDGSEASLLYRMEPSIHVQPRDYDLVIEVYHVDLQNETYLSVAHNSTITILDPEATWDAETIFTYVMLLALVGLGGFYYTQKGGKKPARRAPTQVASSDVAKGTDQIDWDFVPQEHKRHLTGEKPKSPRSPKSPKSPKK